LDCFDDEAIYVTGIGTFVKGKENIRKALEQVCGLKPDLQAQRSTGFTVDNITAWVDEWTMKATLPDGTKLDMKGTSSDILKKQPNGNWAYLVDNPYGAEYLHQ
jgi:ketosteroid isomerase-like protein